MNDKPFSELHPAAKVAVVLFSMLGIVVLAGLIGLAVWGAGWIWHHAIEAW